MSEHVRQFECMCNCHALLVKGFPLPLVNFLNSKVSISVCVCVHVFCWHSIVTLRSPLSSPLSYNSMLQ